MKNILLLILAFVYVYGFSQEYQPLQLRGTVQEERARQSQIRYDNAPPPRAEQNVYQKVNNVRYPSQETNNNVYTGHGFPVVGNNFPVVNTRFVDARTVIAIPLAIGQAAWRDGRIFNPYYLFPPATRRYRPQWYVNRPIYRSPFLNHFNRIRYLNNYNGGQPVYSLTGNLPLNWP